MPCHIPEKSFVNLIAGKRICLFLLPLILLSVFILLMPKEHEATVAFIPEGYKVVMRQRVVYATDNRPENIPPDLELNEDGINPLLYPYIVTSPQFLSSLLLTEDADGKTLRGKLASVLPSNTIAEDYLKKRIKMHVDSKTLRTTLRVRTPSQSLSTELAEKILSTLEDYIFQYRKRQRTDWRHTSEVRRDMARLRYDAISAVTGKTPSDSAEMRSLEKLIATLSDEICTLEGMQDYRRITFTVLQPSTPSSSFTLRSLPKATAIALLIIFASLLLYRTNKKHPNDSIVRMP